MKARRGLLIAIALAVVPAMFSSPAVAQTPYTISVKIMADDKEPTVRRLWEKRYRDRLAAASDIIERCCHVRFKVVAVGTWTSDDSVRDLEKLMNEFERKVKPEPRNWSSASPGSIGRCWTTSTSAGCEARSARTS